VEPVRLLHIECGADLQQAVGTVAQRWSLHYHKATDPRPDPGAERRLLLVNLAVSELDPLHEIVNSSLWGIAEPAAFVYCADGGHGAVLGFVHFFPPPFEAHACVQRILRRPSRPQRLLLIGEAFETMNALKDSLAEAQCGVSMAFDSRQALDLVPMLKPDLALVDLDLPRGEALRLAVRLSAAHTGHRMPLGFFWTRTIARDEFRQHALRAIRDSTMSADDLSRALSRVLAPGGTDW
jgi:CheY-like chemotaxis protein